MTPWLVMLTPWICRFCVNVRLHTKLLKKRQEMTSALDELEEEDPVCFQCFMQTRFNRFFKEAVTAQMKTMMSVQQWQRMYVRTECSPAIRSYLDWKKIFVDADLDFVTMDPSQIQVLAGLSCSKEDHPKLQSAIHEK